jgi:TatA/E family protein of Tat protein translocase
VRWVSGQQRLTTLKKGAAPATARRVIRQAAKGTWNMGAISPIHILIVVIVLVLLFGAKKLPELGKSTGVSIREFK